MNGWFDKADQWLDVLGPNPYVHAVALILIFLVIAKLVDKILCGMVRQLVAKTSSSFDDRAASRRFLRGEVRAACVCVL